MWWMIFSSIQSIFPFSSFIYQTFGRVVSLPRLRVFVKISARFKSSVLSVLAYTIRLFSELTATSTANLLWKRQVLEYSLAKLPSNWPHATFFTLQQYFPVLPHFETSSVHWLVWVMLLQAQRKATSLDLGVWRNVFRRSRATVSQSCS